MILVPLPTTGPPFRVMRRTRPPWSSERVYGTVKETRAREKVDRGVGATRRVRALRVVKPGVRQMLVEGEVGHLLLLLLAV